MNYFEVQYELIGEESFRTLLPEFVRFLGSLGKEYHPYVRKVLTEGGLVMYGLSVVLDGSETEKSHLSLLRSLDEASKKHRMILKRICIIDSGVFSEILRKVVSGYVEVPDGA